MMPAVPTPYSSKTTLWLLMLGNVCIGTGTMIVVGLLNQISASLAVSVSQAAQLLTAFAVACAVGAPVCAALLAGVSRRGVLAAALVLFALCHALAAVVDSYPLLLALRAFTGLGAAIFTPAAAAVAGQLVPPEQRGRAVGFVFLGWGVASVFGVPLGSYLGAVYHWHAAMGVVAAMSLVVAVGVWLTVPNSLAANRVNLAAFAGLLRNRPVMRVVGVTVLYATGLFTMFAYLSPLYRDVVGASPTQIPLLFFVYGAMGLAGSALMARHIDRIGAGHMVGLMIGASCCVLAIWPLSALHISLAFLVAMIWGAPGFAANGAQQARIVGMVGAMAPVGVAFNSSAMYIGQALGSVIGGVYYAQALGWGLPRWGLAWLGLAAALAALGLSRSVERARGA